MLCKDLKDGMLLQVSDEKMCCWLAEASHYRAQKAWPGIPPRFRVGSDAVGVLMQTTTDCGPIYKRGDTIMYLGKKQIFSANKDKSRQIRLVYINGTTGYIEGFDFKYLEKQTVR
jgi:hypothetical protein